MAVLANPADLRPDNVGTVSKEIWGEVLHFLDFGCLFLDRIRTYSTRYRGLENYSNS
jgi:hypothetical protein